MSSFDAHPPRPVDSLERGERERLERAHRRLRQAAEDDGLERSRDAALVVDWFADEDRIYDEV